VEPGGANQRERKQRRPDEPEVAEGFRGASVVGRQASVVSHVIPTGAKRGKRKGNCGAGCRVGLADD
jgi:hypothetical protein